MSKHWSSSSLKDVSRLTRSLSFIFAGVTVSVMLTVLDTAGRAPRRECRRG